MHYGPDPSAEALLDHLELLRVADKYNLTGATSEIINNLKLRIEALDLTFHARGFELLAELTKLIFSADAPAAFNDMRQFIARHRVWHWRHINMQEHHQGLREYCPEYHAWVGDELGKEVHTLLLEREAMFEENDSLEEKKDLLTKEKDILERKNERLESEKQALRG